MEWRYKPDVVANVKGPDRGSVGVAAAAVSSSFSHISNFQSFRVYLLFLFAIFKFQALHPYNTRIHNWRFRLF